MNTHRVEAEFNPEFKDTISNWFIQQASDGTHRVYGTCENGTCIVTSPIEVLSIKGLWVKTLNSFYRLGAQ